MSRPPSPVATAVAGALCIAFSAIFVRLAETAPSTAALFRCFWALPVLGLLAWLEQRRHGPRGGRERLLALLAGLFFAADLIAWHHAIDDVGAGLATVLGNLQVVFVGLIAWAALGERPEDRLLVAVPIVLGGVVLISGVIGAGAYGDDPALGVVFGLITAITYSLFILILRRAGSDLRQPAGPLFDATAAAAVGSLAGGLVLGEIDLLPGWEATGWLVTLALSSQVVGWLLISISLPRLPAALTSVLLTVQPVGSVLLGIVLLSEAPSRVQLTGVAVVLAGILVATVGRAKAAPAAVGVAGSGDSL
ncbi:MAG: DMT family transporter [Thermoleophilaceae bacterium]